MWCCRTSSGWSSSAALSRFSRRFRFYSLDPAARRKLREWISKTKPAPQLIRPWKKKKIIHCRRWRSLLLLLLAGLEEWFTSTQPISIGALLTDAPVIRRRRLSIPRFWLDNMKKCNWCHFVGLRIKVHQPIGMDISLEMMTHSKNFWSLRPVHLRSVHTVILGFQCFIVGRLHLLYWETGRDDYSNVSKTIELTQQGAESTVWKL